MSGLPKKNHVIQWRKRLKTMLADWKLQETIIPNPRQTWLLGTFQKPPKLNQNNIITKHVMVLVKGSSKVDNIPSTMNFKIIVSI